MRQRADLHDTPPRFAAATQVLSAAKLPDTSIADVELRRGERVGVAIGADRAVGAHFARLRERPIEDVGDGDRLRAGEARRDHRQAADRAGAGDEHRLADEIGAAIHRVQRDRERLRERELAERDVAADRIALALAHDEELAEHSLHVRKEARAAEEAHLAAELLATFAAVVALAAGVRRAHGDLVADFHARDAGPDRRDVADASCPGISGSRTTKLPLRPSK